MPASGFCARARGDGLRQGQRALGDRRRGQPERGHKEVGRRAAYHHLPDKIHERENGDKDGWRQASCHQKPANESCSRGTFGGPGPGRVRGPRPLGGHRRCRGSGAVTDARTGSRLAFQYCGVRAWGRRRGCDARGADQDISLRRTYPRTWRVPAVAVPHGAQRLSDGAAEESRRAGAAQSLDEVLPGPHGPTRPDAPHPGKNPEQLADNAGLRRRLRRALRKLPAPYRAIVFLREMEGLSTREVARVMGISEDNVKARLHRARLQLQADLGKGAK